MVKKVFFNTGAQIAGKAITASTTLVLTIIVGKSLGPVGYGDFTKIFTFVGYFYIFSDFGLNAAYIKLSQNEKDNSLINALFSLRLLLATTLAVLSILISQFLPYNPQTGTGFSPLVKIGILVASATILTQALLTSVNAYFQKNLRYDLSAAATAIGTLVTLFATILIFTQSPTLNLYVAAYVLGGAAIVLLALVFVRKFLNLALAFRVLPDKSRDLLKYSWPVGVALIFNLIYFRMDIFILSYVRPPHEVGIYGLAYQFFEATLAVPIFFANSLFPLLTKTFTKDAAEYSHQTKKWALILFFVSILATIGLITISYLLPLFFQKFEGSQPALAILALGLPFFFITSLLWHMVIIANKQKLLIPIYFIGGITNVIMNLIFIPQYGFMAAAVTTVICEALITVLLFISVNFFTGSRTHHLAN